MEKKKVQLNCWVNPEVKAAIDRQADKENRRPGNLGGLLLEWAYRQLQIAGNSLTLSDWEAQPPMKTIVTDALKTDAEVIDRGTPAHKKTRKKAG